MSEPSGRLSRVVLPSAQLPVPVALVVTRLTTQVLVPMAVGFGMGSGAPKRQPLRVPVHVPKGHAERHMPPVLVPVLQSAFVVHVFPLSVLVGGPRQVRPGRQIGRAHV